MYFYFDMSTPDDPEVIISGSPGDSELFISSSSDGYADSHDYMSYDIDNATLNDLYEIGLSIRNCCLIIILLILVIWVHGRFNNLFKRLYKNKF